MATITNLNLLPLGAYSMLLGVDWLYAHQTKVNCYEKAIECLAQAGEQRMLQGKRKPTLVRIITTMQAKRSHRKGCTLFSIHISRNAEANNIAGKEDNKVLDRYLVLQQY